MFRASMFAGPHRLKSGWVISFHDRKKVTGLAWKAVRFPRRRV
jgi:hypothetical protein